MKKSYRPGSMGAADAKMAKTAKIVLTVLFTLALLCWFIPSGLFSHYYFTNAGTVWKVIGFISSAAWYVWLWKLSEDFEGKPIIAFGWIALNLALLSGFTFNLPG